MGIVSKFRNEDLSIYCWLRELLGTKVTQVVDAYPYTDIENSTLVIPSASIEHRLTEEYAGELGSSWFRRTWAIDIFATSDTQRNELADLVFQGLDDGIEIKDFSEGFYIVNNSCKKALIGTELGIIESVQPFDRVMKPTYAFSDPKVKFWRMSISFVTTSTGSNVVGP